MLQGQTKYWILGLAALVAIYATVFWIGWHKPFQELPRQATTEDALPPLPDGPTLTLNLGDGVKLEMVRIPAGDFEMGSPEDEVNRDSSEDPQHPVHIAHDYYMGKFTVTQAQWVEVMKNNQSFFKGDGNLPAEQVSWEDCQKFCQEVSKRSGRKVRLPSEAEWEYACRAGTKTVFAFGNSLSSTQANFKGTDPYGDAAVGPNLKKTMPVGSYKPNAFGLYDMHGNVWEWCQDVFHPDYTGAPADGSAWETGGADPTVRVNRGGSFMNTGDNCRSAIRHAYSQHDMRTNSVGFRIAADLLPPPSPK